uniref:Beta-ketoacyl-[acyl-carrier-protein] synthase family protein n=1 Tax=Desulfacinum infernum TaxID=35837 RepID=A0A832A8N2_9BACT
MKHKQPARRRVVVTGFEMITALGLDWQSTWHGLLEGRSGVDRIRRFDASAYDTCVAAELPEACEAYCRRFIKARRARQMARATLVGVTAAKKAVENAALVFEALDRDRCAVVMGVVDTGYSACLDDDAFWVLKTMPHALSAWVALEYKLSGPNYSVSAACASAAFAIAQAYDLITTDQADVVLTGGASAIVNPEHVAGFNELQALSTRKGDPRLASRPFSQGRDGFVMGEGAGVLVMESEESATARGAHVWGEILGYALTSETYNIMAPAKDGQGMAHTMRKALHHAGLTPEDVDYINAHGTSTPFNDRYETLAIKDVFGPRAVQIPVSSTKSMIGHTAAAAGGIEAIVCLLSLYHGKIHPTINYEPDPELDLDYVPMTARAQRIQVALSNSFGFGGVNATLVLAAYPNTLRRS